MKKIVITGATGIIGIHLIKQWLKTKNEIYAVTRPDSKNIVRIPKSSNVHIIELSLDRYDHLQRMIGNADYFYHLAWEGTRAPYRNNPEIQKNNFTKSIKAFEAAKEMGCSFFLGTGSQAEYGPMLGVVDEESPCYPTTEYGKWKNKTNNILSDMSLSVSMKYIWVRLFSIYGQYDYPGTLIMQCINKMENNQKIEMTAGTQIWDYLYIEDAVKAMVMFAAYECNNGTYILASGDQRPLKEYILELKNILRSNSDVLFGVIPYGINNNINLLPNINKIHKEIGWKPEYSFCDGIRDMYTKNKELNTIA